MPRMIKKLSPRKISTAALGGLILFTLAACGSSSDKPAATVPADADLVVYAGPGIKFDQTQYTVTAGDVVIAYQNRDSQRHTLDIIGDNNTVIGKQLAVGKSGDVDTESVNLPAGTYSLQCLVPGHDAMRATLTVK
jgi:plastocyanin